MKFLYKMSILLFLLISCNSSKKSLINDMQTLEKASITIIKGLKVKCTYNIDFIKRQIYTDCVRFNSINCNSLDSIKDSLLKKNIAGCFLKAKGKEIDFGSNDACLMEIIIYRSEGTFDTLTYTNFLADEDVNQLRKSNIYAYRIFNTLQSCK